MKEGPDIALIGSLIGDPARANMLSALMSGKALTATELAAQSNITAQTASSHLSKLQAGGLIRQSKQGRHRYFSIADEDVASVLESMIVLAALKGHVRVRTGPKDPAMRRSRVCYNHLAGEFGVQMFDSMIENKFIRQQEEQLDITPTGRVFVSDLGIDLDALQSNRRPLCKSCLDWSARRHHLAGSLGTALLDYFFTKNWAKRQQGTRVVSFTKTGEAAFAKTFPV